MKEEKYEETMEIVKKIALKVNESGGKMYFVGGMVRDEVMNTLLNTKYTNKDIDTETFGISVENFKRILSSFGEVDFVGESFGVFKIKHLDVDFAMPRTEKKVGEKHTDFEVSVNPYLPLEIATKRRDFTINQLMKDVITDEIIDKYNGIEDIKNHKIKHINDETFQEDALRIFRAAQFAARFNFEIDKDTIELSKLMNVKDIANERVESEFAKALKKSNKPSIFFKYLKEMNHLDEFFMFNSQMEKNLELLDKSTFFTNRTKYKKEFLLAVLFFNVNPKIIYKNLSKLTNQVNTLQLVTELNENILTMLKIDKLNKTDIRLFCQKIKYLNELMLYAELLGMNKELLMDIKEDFEKVAKIPLIRGRNLISLGLQPSPEFGKLLEKANYLQCEGYSKEEILKRLV